MADAASALEKRAAKLRKKLKKAKKSKETAEEQQHKDEGEEGGEAVVGGSPDGVLQGLTRKNVNQPGPDGEKSRQQCPKRFNLVLSPVLSVQD